MQNAQNYCIARSFCEYCTFSIRCHGYYLFCCLFFVWLLSEGSVYLFGKLSDINNCWITSNTMTNVRCCQQYVQPSSSAASHGNELYSTNSPSCCSSKIISIYVCVCVPRILVMASSELLLIVKLLFEGSYYAMVASIRRNKNIS